MRSSWCPPYREPKQKNFNFGTTKVFALNSVIARVRNSGGHFAGNQDFVRDTECPHLIAVCPQRES